MLIFHSYVSLPEGIVSARTELTGALQIVQCLFCSLQYLRLILASVETTNKRIVIL